MMISLKVKKEGWDVSSLLFILLASPSLHLLSVSLTSLHSLIHNRGIQRVFQSSLHSSSHSKSLPFRSSITSPIVNRLFILTQVQIRDQQLVSDSASFHRPVSVPSAHSLSDSIDRFACCLSFLQTSCYLFFHEFIQSHQRFSNRSILLS